jgi:hypothetical protein
MKVYLGNQLINRVYSGNKELVTQNLPDVFDLEYVVVAGGGSGALGGAGGGAGGAITGSYYTISTPSKRSIFTVTIGNGAPTSSTATYSGSRGEDTYFGNPSIFELTAIGGGGGGSFGSGSGWTPGVRSGSFGGSGGGGAASTGSRGLGTANQGNNGGFIGGGGGGATAEGGTGTVSTVGNGGAGHYIWWNKYNSGSVADGGGCGSFDQIGAGIAGGIAGGPSGGDGGSLSGDPLTFSGRSAPQAGGGGGGGGRSSGFPPFADSTGGAGGSGIVLIKYSGQPKGSGGEIYTTGSYTVHAFTSSGIFTV